jgi:hypothetical protein
MSFSAGVRLRESPRRNNKSLMLHETPVNSLISKTGAVLALEVVEAVALLQRFERCEMELEALVRRIRGEFLEMPGLSLTFAQATRLWGIEHDLCERVVGALVGTSFLRRTPTGHISRADF